jgi:hypothetical protein
MQHNHALEHVLKFQLTQGINHSHKMLNYFFELHVCCEWGYYDVILCTVHAVLK